MSLWSLTAAAVFAGLTVGSQGAPQPAAPPAPAVHVEAVQEDSGPRVSVDFKNAQVGEVLDWLSKNGANFVAADSELPKDATITMSVKDASVNDVANAIASALGGHWERQGDVRVFRKGEGFGNFTWTAPKGAPGSGEKHFRVFGDGSNFKVFGDDGGNFVAPDLKDMPDLKNIPMPDLKDLPDMDSLGEQLKDLPGMTEESRAEVEKAMKQAQEEMAKSGVQMKISKKAMERAQKEMEKARKEHPEAFGNGGQFYVMPNDGKARVYRFRNGQGSGFGFGDEPKISAPRFTLRGHDLTNLLESLSPEQKELNRRQGYLKASDLNEAQRKMIGVPADGKDWTISVSRNGETVTIKSDR